MSFTSSAFVGFLAVVFVGLQQLPSRARLPFLLAANAVFCCWWDWRALLALAASTLITFACAAQIARSRSAGRRNSWLVVNLVGSLGLLGYFKYFDFFAGNLSSVLASVGIGFSPTLGHIALPLGVSYYTFQTLSYTLDIYRGQLKPTPSVLRFAAFASFFPHIVAGPITRARDFLPQLARDERADLADVEAGLSRFLQGLFKKVVVADVLGAYLVDPVFADPTAYTVAAHWLSVLGYAAQVYADFSGYSSMALGVARVLGYRLPENFRYPYLATDIAEFWRRWHITLTRWLREYLWWPLTKDAPMSGGWRTRLRSRESLVVVFLVCGLWHGATWVFVAWGALHGLYMVMFEVWRHRRGGPREPDEAGPRVSHVLPAWLVTQAAVVFSWVLFRSATFRGFHVFLQGLIGSPGKVAVELTPVVALALLAFLTDHVAGWLMEHREGLRSRVPAYARAAFYVALILLMFHARPERVSPFIYFQF